MRVVIDTNVFVMCLTSRSPYHSIFQKLVAGHFELALSNEILLEYQEIIHVKYGEETCAFFLQLLDVLPNIKRIDVYYHWNLITKDPDDDKFVDCFVASASDLLVSEDKHFKVLRQVKFPEVKVITADSFLRTLNPT